MKQFKLDKFVLGVLLVCTIVMCTGTVGCASKLSSQANRYPSVSPAPIRTGPPIESPEKVPILQKPIPRIK